MANLNLNRFVDIFYFCIYLIRVYINYVNLNLDYNASVHDISHHALNHTFKVIKKVAEDAGLALFSFSHIQTLLRNLHHLS